MTPHLLILASALVPLALGVTCQQSLSSAPSGGQSDALALPPGMPQDVVKSDSPEPHALVPGDCLLDLLSSSRLEQYPLTNLPDEVLEFAQGPFRMRTPRIPPELWIQGGVVPESIERELKPASKMRLWKAQPRLTRAADNLEVRVLDDGEEMVAARAGEALERGSYAWWDEKLRCVFAIAEQKPGNLVLEYFADPKLELGRYELGLSRDAALSGLRPDGFALTIEPKTLLRRFDIGKVSRPGLLLPATSALSIPVDKLMADRLRVSVGVIDSGYQARDGWMEGSRGLCDGVTFMVLAECGGPAEIVWSRFLNVQQIGRRFFDDVVDLSAYVGKSLTLRLVTQTGRHKAPWYDYGVWADLRLQGTPSRTPAVPDIVLIDIDTLRADRLGCYGYSRPTSPRIDAWARDRSVLYESCTSTAPWTLPSTASILTGMAVHQHRVKEFPRSITQATPTLAVVLKAAGYETCAVTDGGYLGPSFGFDLGFDYFEYSTRRDPSWDWVVDFVKGRRSERPLFLFLQTYLVHAPYLAGTQLPSGRPYSGRFEGQDVDYPNIIDPYLTRALELTEEDRRYVSDCYDGEIVLMDEMVGKLLDEIAVTFDPRRTLVLLTSDHGEEFFERDMLGHGQSLFQELLHVPLIVQFPLPGEGPRVGRVAQPVTTLDIVPTILQCAGISIPGHLPGQSLDTGQASNQPRVAHHKEHVYSLEWQGYKLIDGRIQNRAWTSPAAQLFDLSKDPGEKHDLADREQAKVEELRELFKRYRERYEAVAEESEAEVDPALRELLEAMGYLDKIKPDPPPEPSAGQSSSDGRGGR